MLELVLDTCWKLDHGNLCGLKVGVANVLLHCWFGEVVVDSLVLECWCWLLFCWKVVVETCCWNLLLELVVGTLLLT